MNIKKWLLASGSIAALLAATLCLADEVPINICTQYLSASDNAFYSLVSSNASAAASAAQSLDACQVANACAEINGIDNCATILANRFFVSEYYAMMNSNGASSYGNTAPQNGSAKLNNSENNANAAAVRNKSSNKNDSSIHWF